ncbi:PSME3-interacting protein-like [Liolophura sinensis]|uniref:PSME3-interacting protein-like n=1 Tax=Liolophura sinensis TaxID=3198878 RepID=UPI003159736D
MSFSNQEAPGIGFKKFVSEEELEEKRKKRQEEWDKVRQPDDPEECPEEKYDPRSLFEQLEDQKNKKQEEYEEQFKLRNQVKGLGEDEAEFLDYVSNRQIEINRQRAVETDSILQEMRESKVEIIAAKDNKQEEKKVLKPQVGASQGKSQMALLAGAIKRKSSDAKDDEKKRKLSGGDSPSKETKDNDKPGSSSANSVAKIIGVLPGLGEYTNDTSDSETSSSDSEVEVKATDSVIIRSK